ncbi:MAG: hypothetical protein J3K34DRAFT_456563 [Monoraphidium minutum]|nr:MAG: hypothetical protein J3K34DRAFT_456563 [Monoraphidium minutum]
MAAAPADEEAVARLMESTGADADQARFLLEAANGNPEAAAHMYFEHLPGASGRAAAPAPAAPARAPRPQTPPRPRAPGARPPAAAPTPPGARNVAGAYPARRAGGGVLGRVLRLPVAALRAVLGAVASVAQLALAVAALAGDRVLPRGVMRALRGMADAFIAANSPAADPAQQAADFAAAFAAAFGGRGPEWLPVGWSQATTAAHAQFKFLFVYLHSPDHEDTDAFCRGVLCSPELLAYINEHFVAWGGDIRRPDAFTLASRLHVTTYPCVALLAYPGARTKVVACLQGRFAGPQLLAALRRAADEHGVLLAAERAQHEEREMSRVLLDEQNREYEEALAADREKAARRRAEAEAAEREAREREEAEAAAQAEVEAAERRRAAAEEALAARRAAAASSLPPEPPPGAPAAAVRVRLPDGANHHRRFAADAAVGGVYDWVDSLEGCTFRRYTLVCNFPRRVYGADSRGLSLEAAGLAPQGVLFVQAEDDDEGEGGGGGAAAGGASGSGA